jgi:hypothetical protein
VAPPPATVQKRQGKVTLALAQVLALLRSPRSISTAIVLREIFDEPLSRRRR